MAERELTYLVNNETRTEFLDRRSYTRRAFKGPNHDSDPKSIKYDFRIRHRHYKVGEQFEDIDTALIHRGGTDGWKMEKSSYRALLPEYSDGLFRFQNVYEGANHTIDFRAKSGHVQGVATNSPQGNYVFYKDAYGSGIHLKVWTYHHGFQKQVIIDEKPINTSPMNFDFELDNDSLLEFKSPNNSIWDKQTDLDFQDKEIRIGNNGKYTLFRKAKMWDSKRGSSKPVPIKFRRVGGKVQFRKTLPTNFLENAVYPIYTDGDIYFSGAGDGYISHNDADYDTGHDASVGTTAAYTGGSFGNFVGAENISTFFFYRSFLPIDTSGINDGDTITDAVLNIYNELTVVEDNDGDDFIVAVQTSQASTSSLITDDFDQCGSVNNPTEGSDKLDLSSLTDNQYNILTLNATGRGWINKTGTTLLGLREGHDAQDIQLASSSSNYSFFAASETSGTDNDPYLEVTTSAGGPPPTTPKVDMGFHQGVRIE